MSETQNNNSGKESSSKPKRSIGYCLFLAAVFLLTTFLCWHLLRDRGPTIDPNSPAAQLKRDDSEKQKKAQEALEAAKAGKSGVKEAKLFVTAEVEPGESRNGEWRFAVLLKLDEEKCSDWSGSEEQCRELWATAKLAPESWKLEPRLPVTFKVSKDQDSGRVDFAVPLADLPDPEKYKSLVLTLPRLAPKAEQGESRLELELPPWTLTPKVSRVFPNPESPSKLLIQATLESSRPLNRESVEKKLRFLPEGEELALGKPQIRWAGDYSLSVIISVINLPLKNGSLTMILEPGAQVIKGGYGTTKPVQSGSTIPSRDEAVGVASLRMNNLEGQDEVLRPLLMVEFTLPVHSTEARKSVAARLLPLYRDKEDEKANRPFNWGNLQEIPEEVLKAAPVVVLKPEPVSDEFSSVFAFRYSAPSERWLHIAGSGGLESRGGLAMKNSWDGVRQVPKIEPELRFMQEGNILALSGARKLALMSRGLDGINWQAFRVRPNYLNLLAGKSNTFTEPGMYGEQLEMEDISDALEGSIELSGGEGINPQYSSLDLGKLLEKGSRGIFQINLAGQKNGDEVEQTRRFVLLTDLGLVIKKGIRGERSVFVASLAKGDPVAGAEVRVIARNGVVLLKKVTDQDGRADLPDLEGFVREKAPVAFDVRHGADMTYMKFEDYENAMSTGFSNNIDRLSADGVSVFAFSERGVYRPGETLHFGLVAKDSLWNSQTALPPLSVRLLDPMDREIVKRVIKLSREGFGEISLPTQEHSPTGRYNLAVSLGDQEIGSAGVQVEDFQPDRIRVKSEIVAVPAAEKKVSPLWLLPENLRAEVRVENLYGAPVRGGQVKASFSARRATADFIKYEDFSFFAPAPESAPVLENEDLSELATDDNGRVSYDLPLHKLEDGTYAFSFTAEGFEAGGGRSVISRTTALISPFSNFIGWRASSRLNFVPKNATAQVEFIALGRSGSPEPSEPLTMKIMAVDHKSVLVRIPSGAYRYETQRRTRLVKDEALSIPAEGVKFNLPTGTPGDFEVVLEDGRGAKRNGFAFTVAGAADRGQGLKRDATLRVKLDKENYNSGEEIKIFISAPYAGAGLITLESDRVLAHKWFHAASADSVQSITAPADFEGRGFLMVHMLRDIGSGEIHANPYSQALVPFLANMTRRDMGLTLQTPDKVIPGRTMTLGIKARKPGKVVVFAVDEGILQLTSYKNPSPLNYFLRDKSHEVQGLRNWHLLMPEYGLVRKESAFGGGFSADALSRLNPFRRKGEDSVVYWSGLVDVGPEQRDLTWEVPTYFNGQLRVMAVAAGMDGVGETAGRTLVNAPVIITPILPVAVAPGDSFDVTVTLANTVEGSGKNAAVTFGADVTDALVFESEPEKAVLVDEGRETRVSFRLKASDRLGESTISLSASIGEGDKAITVRRPVSLSVRPASPRIAAFAAGRLKSKEQTIPVARELYPQFASVRASLSGLPLPLAGGLAGYLIAFPHGCTEQVLSSAFPYVLLRGQEGLLTVGANTEKGALAESGKTGEEVAQRAALAVGKGVQTLRERRLEPGRYSLWPQESESYGFLSIYALDYLVSAREAGFAAPQDLLSESARETRSFLLERPKDLDEARLTAYAAWVYARAGALGFGERFRDMSNLVKHCDQTLPGWRKDISAALLAGTYSMLKQNKEAADLLKDVEAAQSVDGKTVWNSEEWFLSPLWADGLYLSILARHFPERLQDDAAFRLLANLVNAVSGGKYTTTGAVQAIRGISSYAAAMLKNNASDAVPAITALDSAHKPLPFKSSGDIVKTVSGDNSIAEFAFSGGENLYWQISSDGFDRVLPPGKTGEKIDLRVDFIPASGGPLSELKQGDEVNVRVRAKTTNGKSLDNVAITSLLPGAFEMIIARGGEIVDAGAGGSGHFSDTGNNAPVAEGQTVKSAVDHKKPMRLAHAERREDRMVLYASLDGTDSEYVYRIKAVNKGRFALPAAFAEALYDPDARARTSLGRVEVK